MKLRGVAWDHPRGLAPLQATAARYQREHPGFTLTWDARSLRSFEEQSIAELAEDYDIITIDHPFVGTAAEQGVLLPLDEFLPAEYLAEQLAGSTGDSHVSYQWAGRQWALAVDSAAQACAYRPDLFDRSGTVPPRTWPEVHELARSLPSGQRIAIPWNPTHLLCCFLSMCVNRLDAAITATSDVLSAWFEDGRAGNSVVAEVLTEMYALAEHVHPLSHRGDPILILNEMSARDEIAYVPVTFAYSTYSRARPGSALVRFGGIPSVGPVPNGSMLGGVGLAVSRQCQDPGAAVGYLQAVASPDWQRRIYFDAGGQPAHRSAWLDADVNREAADFFSGTLETVDLAFMRPRRPGYPEFQRRAGADLHELFAARSRPGQVADRLAALWSKGVESSDG